MSLCLGMSVPDQTRSQTHQVGGGRLTDLASIKGGDAGAESVVCGYVYMRVCAYVLFFTHSSGFIEKCSVVSRLPVPH